MLSSPLRHITAAAILSATGAHWEETAVDYWNMNTDTRSTAVVLDTFINQKEINASGDEMIPRQSVLALYEAARRPKR